MSSSITKKTLTALFVVILVGMALFIHTNATTIQALAQTEINRYVYKSVCDTPIHYKIGTIDSRFNLTQNELMNDLSQSTQIWDKVEGKNLFDYDQANPDSLTVNLTYDKRQQLTTQINTLKDQASQVDQNLKPKIAAYNQEKADFEKQITDLNSQIDSWNQKGGAPDDVYQQLTKKQQDLQTESDKLNQEAQSLNLTAKSYNSDISNLNQTITTFNNALHQEPEEGLFDPNNNSITIYFSNGQNELIHTLTHELGHSLGLDHNQNENSIMYPYTSQNIVPTPDDITALNQVCSKRYLAIPHWNLINIRLSK